VFAHFARKVGQDLVLIIQFHPEHGSGQHRRDGAFKFDWLFVGQKFPGLIG
jgi:hypothetical protein